MTGPLIFVVGELMRNLLEKKWEFETDEGWMADAFIQVLNMFNIVPEDVYIPSFLEFSQIEFRATKERMLQIEYVFERYVGGRRGRYYAIC